MTGLCPTCSRATEVQHIGRTRIPVEFCPRCNAVTSHTPPNRPTPPDGLADDEYTHESLANARYALAETRSLTPGPESGTVSNRERQVTADTTPPMDPNAAQRPMDRA